MERQDFQIDMKMIEDPSVNKEVKVNIILEMLYSDEISLRKAKELCTQSGIFSKHWMNVEEEVIQVSHKFHKKERRKNEYSTGV